MSTAPVTRRGLLAGAAGLLAGVGGTLAVHALGGRTTRRPARRRRGRS